MRIKNILKIIAQPIMMLSYHISGLFRRNPNIWVFGAWRGQQYSDNTKYLFEYINEKHSEIKCIWVTKNPAIAKKLIGKGYEVCCGHTIRTLWYVLSAGVAFETEGVQDIPFHWFMKGIKTIQLFHGFPLKSGSKWVEHGQFIRSSRPWHNQYDKMYWMSTSPKYSEIYHNWELFGVTVPEEQFFITGYARNDTFIKKPQNDFLERFHKENPTSKLICYMPTHRNFGDSTSDVLNEENLLFVNKRLREMETFMIFKPHFHEIKHYIGKEYKFDHIVFAYTEEFSDAYEYLHSVDLLISDYSSIMVDYLCANKPIVVFDYDLEEYMENDAGLENIYFELDFGPRCKSWREVLDAVELQLREDIWMQKRKTALDITQSFNDGMNCERIYRSVNELLSK